MYDHAARASIRTRCLFHNLPSLHIHPGGNPGANLKSISHRCHLFEVAVVWKLTQETIHLPVGCLQCGFHNLPALHNRRDIVRYSRFDQDQVPLS